MTRILAIDPGSAKSAWLRLVDNMPAGSGIDPNPELVEAIQSHGLFTSGIDVVVIEFMSPRGMPTSAEEMEALWWAGRFAQAAQPLPVERLKRDKVKFHLCGNRNAKDTNVRQALIDRFGGIGGKETAVGRKATPGPLYGVANDEWAALAVAVAWTDGVR